MALGFVFINCKLGFEKDVTEQLNQIDNVKEVKNVFGEYDILVTLETISVKVLDEVISLKIQKINNLNSTLPLMTAE